MLGKAYIDCIRWLGRKTSVHFPQGSYKTKGVVYTAPFRFSNS